MNKTLGSIPFAIFAALCLFGVKMYYKEHDFRQKMDTAVDARLSQDLAVPLDCPPLGKRQVIFLSDEADSETRQDNLAKAVKQWEVVWPSVYRALETESADDKEKARLSENPEIKVTLPAVALNDDAKWSLEYVCSIGYYNVELVGLKATNATIGN